MTPGWPLNGPSMTPEWPLEWAGMGLEWPGMPLEWAGMPLEWPGMPLEWPGMPLECPWNGLECPWNARGYAKLHSLLIALKKKRFAARAPCGIKAFAPSRNSAGPFVARLRDLRSAA